MEEVVIVFFKDLLLTSFNDFPGSLPGLFAALIHWWLLMQKRRKLIKFVYVCYHVEHSFPDIKL